MIYIFENYSLDADRRELRAGTELVPVEPQVFDVLQYLICNREHVVSKDDLIAGVWKGRIVSESTLSSSIAAVRQSVGDSGETQGLIRTVPRKGFRFVGEVRESTGDQAALKPVALQERNEAARPGLQGNQVLTLPDKPSIAVLPFVNWSDDPDQEYFADGITEDLITALSQFRMFFVIARGSSFNYKGRSVDIKQVGRELGVRYVLEGSVRKVANRVRITGQLSDASSGLQLWADRFDGALEEIFDLQDRVTASVAGAIAPKLEQAEIERSKRKQTDNLDAYDYFLRGMATAARYTKEGFAESNRFFALAIERDPDFAAAYGLTAWNFVTRKTNGWMVDPQQELAEGIRLARRAVELGNDDAIALSSGAMGIAYLGHEVEAGITHTDRALILNPNLGSAWYISGWLRIFRGEHKKAVEHIDRAIRFSPLDPLIFRAYSAKSYAYLFLGKHAEALEWAERAVRMRPTWLTAVRGAAACYALTGNEEEARKWIMRMRETDPRLCLSNLQQMLPLQKPSEIEVWANAMRTAGLPE